MDAMQVQLDSLKRQLEISQAENDAKDHEIKSLKSQLKEENDEMTRRSGNLQKQINAYMRSRSNKEEDDRSPSTEVPTLILGSNFSHSSNPSETSDDTQQRARENTNNSTNNDSRPSHKNPGRQTRIRDMVDEIQKWLFLEGGNLRDVESLITEYANFVRDSIGIPLDRIFIAGMMLHPQMSAYVWKWEVDEKFSEHEVPHSAFQKPNYNPNEPFAVLMEGRSMNFRMKADDDLPPGCAWFQEHNYQDYYALPIYHRGEFKGAFAWCTKSAEGWNDMHIQIFEQSLAALSTILRLHTNDLVLKTLTERLQAEVTRQTHELAEANQRLEAANQKIVQQAQAQLRHFAMMSHEIRTPLNCIVGLSNLIMLEHNMGDFDLPDNIKEPLEMITNSGDLLLAVVDDVLDYAKLAAGKVETQMQPCSLMTAINTVVFAIRAKATAAGLDVRTHYDPNLPVRLRTDSRRLQQVSTC